MHKFKQLSKLNDSEMEALAKSLEALESRRRSGELADAEIFVVIEDVVVKARLPAGKIRQDFMSGIGHAIRADRDYVRARIEGRRDAKQRPPRGSRGKLKVVS